MVGTLVTALAACCLAGCSYEWDSNAPIIPLTGDAPGIESFEKLNDAPLEAAVLMTAKDGLNWIYIQEQSSPGYNRSDGPIIELIVPLAKARAAGASAQRNMFAPTFTPYAFHHAVYNDATLSRPLTIYRPGEAPVVIPGRRLVASSGGANDTFVTSTLSEQPIGYNVMRLDQGVLRIIPPEIPGYFSRQFTTDGKTLVVAGQDSGQVVALATEGDAYYRLGTRSQSFILNAAPGVLLDVDGAGLHSVPLEGQAEVILASSSTIDPTSPTVVNGAVAYIDAGALYRVPLDGSAPPLLLQPTAARILAIGPHGEIVYSLDTADRYASLLNVGSAPGDGWIGGQRFMERGVQIQWSADGSRIDFLEDAANVDGVGTLTTASATNFQSPSALALNVQQFAELPDGRLVVAENAALPGPWNRVVVIDLVAATRRWLIPGSSSFAVTAGGTELIAYIQNADLTYDARLVEIPVK